MKILIIHAFYIQPGGEDKVVEAEIELLRQRGNEVRYFGKNNKDTNSLGNINIAIQTIWSRLSANALKEDLKAWRPDVVHIHNTFPLISPSIYWILAEENIPVVQTLHNFRLLCIQAMFLRNGKLCEDCLGRGLWRGVTHGCYRGSIAQSTVLAGMVTMHRAIGTWQDKVTKYIALNSFCREKFIAGGLPSERIIVKPNFLNAPALAPRQRTGFLFVGRLSKEKGVDVLARSVQSTGLRIRAAGTGSEARTLEKIPEIKMLGALPASAINDEMATAIALILPSIWYENFPRTLVEAFANGLPVIASKIGSLNELVEEGQTGLFFEPGDASDLKRVLVWAQAHPMEMAEMGKKAYATFCLHYTADRNYGLLLSIYQAAIDELHQ